MESFIQGKIFLNSLPASATAQMLLKECSLGYFLHLWTSVQIKIPLKTERGKKSEVWSKEADIRSCLGSCMPTLLIWAQSDRDIVGHEETEVSIGRLNDGMIRVVNSWNVWSSRSEFFGANEVGLYKCSKRIYLLLRMIFQIFKYN